MGSGDNNVEKRSEDLNVTNHERNYSTQWSGQFFVAGELCKRQYLLSFPLGNAKETDLMVESPEGAKFRVEVKTQRTVNFWRYKRREIGRDLFYIFVYLNEIGQKPRFFVLRSEEARKEWDEYYVKHPKEGRKPTDYGLGTSFRSIEKYENKWETLPK